MGIIRDTEAWKKPPRKEVPKALHSWRQWSDSTEHLQYFIVSLESKVDAQDQASGRYSTIKSDLKG